MGGGEMQGMPTVNSVTLDCVARCQEIVTGLANKLAPVLKDPFDTENAAKAEKTCPLVNALEDLHAALDSLCERIHI